MPVRCLLSLLISGFKGKEGALMASLLRPPLNPSRSWSDGQDHPRRAGFPPRRRQAPAESLRRPPPSARQVSPSRVPELWGPECHPRLLFCRRCIRDAWGRGDLKLLQLGFRAALFSFGSFPFLMISDVWCGWIDDGFLVRFRWWDRRVDRVEEFRVKEGWL